MIHPRPDAPCGRIAHYPTYSPSSFPVGCAVLCRNNAPLVALAFELVRRDVPVRVLGRKFGDGLAKLVDRSKCDSCIDLLTWLSIWQLKKLASCDERQAYAINDQYECLHVLARSSRNCVDVTERIKRLFDDNAGASHVTLSTIHKAKGLEWDTVFILDSWLIPPKWCKTQDGLDQERNLMYVAVTRAKTDVVYIESGKWNAAQR